MADPDQPRIIRFGSFEVDKRTGELRKNGSRIKLQQQPLQILLALIERRGPTPGLWQTSAPHSLPPRRVN
jgi:DNA-binding response OmpR family regulator